MEVDSAQDRNETVAYFREHAPDLSSLYKLIHDSTEAYAPFDQHGFTILEQRLQEEVPFENLTLIRHLAHLQRSLPENLPTNTREEYIKRYLEPQSELSDSEEPDSLECNIQDEMDSILTPGERLDCMVEQRQPDAYSPLQLLALIRHVYSLAQECVDYYEGACSEAKPDISYQLIDERVLATLSKVPYVPDIYGPASWTEIQRAARGLWRIQLAFECHDASKRAPVDSEWHYKDECPKVFALYQGWNVQYLELETVYNFLVDHPLVPMASFMNGDTSRARFILPLGAYEYNSPSGWPDLPVRPEANKSNNPEFRIKAVPHGYYFAQSITQDQKLVPSANLDAQSFLHFGFAIWDKPRLHRMDLIHSPEGQEQDGFDSMEDKTHKDKVYTWVDFLGEDTWFML